MSASPRIWLLVTLALPLALLPAAAQARVELYRPEHRTVSELLPIAVDLLLPAGSAAADVQTGTLVLRGESPAIAATLRALDVPLKRLRLTSLLTRRGEHRAMGVEIAPAGVELAEAPSIALDSEAAPRLESLFSGADTRQRSQWALREGSWGLLWTDHSIAVELHLLREEGGAPDPASRLFSSPRASTRRGFRVRAIARGGAFDLEILAVRERADGSGGVVETGDPLLVRLAGAQPVAVVPAGPRFTGMGFAGSRRSSHSQDLLLLRVELAAR